MIFLTVGTQLGFDRLTRAVDDWAQAQSRDDVFGQIADPGGAGYRPKHFEWEAFISPSEFSDRFSRAEFVIAHAGMGTIISALSHGKPLMIMPRRADLGEQRNDHQLATAKRFGEKPGVFVAQEAADVPRVLEKLTSAMAGWVGSTISPFADDGLINAVRAEIFKGR